jgi:hypothetical protein
MTTDKWVERWVVPSSSGNGNYIVSKDKDGNYACGCRGWTMNVRKYCPDCGLQLDRKDPYCWRCKKEVKNPRIERIECSHIREVKAGGGKKLADATIDILAGRG